MVVSKGNCIRCGKEFKKYKKSGEAPAKFCSNACRIVKENHGVSICESCGKDFKWYRGPSQSIPRVCSHKCQGKLVKEWRSKHGFSWNDINDEKLLYQLKIGFDERVEKTETCWIWKGSKISRGYGSFHSDGNGKRISAHRLSWTIHNGKIPEGLVVRHKCNNPICVNPDHLAIGTFQDNSNDRIEAGNSGKGSKNCKASLDEEKVKEIKNLLNKGLSGSEIGRRFGVSRTSINAIKKERTWKHVTL